MKLYRNCPFFMQEKTYPTREDIKQIIDAEVKNER